MATWTQMQIQQQWLDDNGDPASGYVLKAYDSGTLDNISIAIDSSGSSPQTTITLNAEGKFEVSGNEILPYIDRKHKWGIFANATDAAADTPFFAGPYDAVEAISSASTSIAYTPTGTGASATTVDVVLDRMIYSSDYDTLQNAANAAEDATLVIDADVAITTEVTLKSCFLIFQNAKVTSTGSLRGVITNETIPYSGIRVEHNIELAKNRSANVDTGDFYLDPCLGDDTANGTTSSTPVKTLAQLRTLINTEIALAADTAIVAIVRSGRIEVSTQVDFDTSQSTATVTIKANSGEQPYLSGPLKWFPRSGATATNDSTDVYALYAADLDNKLMPIATTLTSEGGLARNQNQAITVATNTCTLAVSSDIETIIDAATNLDQARLHVTQSWTSSIYHGIAISGANMTYTKPSAQGNFYYNGFDDGVADGFAPFFIEGLSSSKTPETWCNNGTTLSLPDTGEIFFAPTQLQQPILVSANKYIFEGIPIKYHQPTKTNVEDDFTSTPQKEDAFMYISGDDCEFISASVQYVEGSGVFGDGNNCHLNDNKDCYWVGHSIFYIGLDTDPETVTGGEILRNTARYWGTNNAGGRAAMAGADDMEIKDNVFYDGPVTAISNQADSSTSITNQVFRNVCYNLGMPEGRKNERFMVADAGGIYYNGISVTADNQMNQNVVFNVCGHEGTYGMYIDNAGIGGTYNENLVFNTGGQAFYNRNVSGLTDNNSYNRNVFFGTVVAADVATGTWNKNIIVGEGGLGQKTLGAGLTVTDVDSGKFIEGRAESNFVRLRDIDSLYDDGVTSLRGTVPSQYIQELDVRYVNEGSFNPVVEGTSAAGSGTYTLQKGDYRVQGDYVEFNLRVTWSAHTGTGNIQINIDDIPYTAKADASMVYPIYLWSNVSATTGYVGQNSQLITIDPSVALGGTGSIAIQGKFPL
jgi:hypothetical protein